MHIYVYIYIYEFYMNDSKDKPTGPEVYTPSHFVPSHEGFFFHNSGRFRFRRALLEISYRLTCRVHYLKAPCSGRSKPAWKSLGTRKISGVREEVTGMRAWRWLEKLIDHERWWHFLLKDKQQYTKKGFFWLTILDSSRIAILHSNIFPISDNFEVQNCTSGKGERGWNFLQLSSFRMNEGSEKRRC